MPVPYWPQTALLHDHGDGAKPLGDILAQLQMMADIRVDPRRDYTQIYRQRFLDVHSNIIEAFSHINKLLQTWDALYLAAWNHVVVRAKQGFRYNEIMFAPQYHCFGKLTPKRVVEALVAGIKKAEEGYPDTETNLLFAIGRELKSHRAVKLLKVLEQCDRNYVVGANIVCDENKFPPERHRKTIEYALNAGINLEVHVSEWVRRPKQAPDFQRDLLMLIKNLRVVLGLFKKFKSKAKRRLGHGIALPYDSESMKFIADEQIGVTGCPGSNLQGRNIPDLKVLKIREMLRREVLWSMNPDDDFFQPELNEVFQMCDDAYRFTDEEKQKLLQNPWLTRFGNRKEHIF
ncbi:MAG: hypothetical protein A3I26_01510 [Candidatus Yanofskybacteria bacterium RIFCSPLOWO2_02_FULL_43_10]|uniref:Adenosine deaminase domain-containing protein n=1 Tax=Candidatus Yanofskybacteria bacterium RIFCSPLOWO2_12_FULL_43_11b TaxID=1802710 RepID=A0A1F8H796_9BACT|nr:MAG: hypothetical protein A2742_01090 [Candidatus Yanofskybacteria bacterium RIFCSPHIGHO2_01_FULL_43_32]OGN11937.1 MAG: hypothetical protein A3C69_02630 [Candidatus Yanofskybacteria bacterium RIFCSPHIGHO2_02_FULL_43_12]OGN24348.1 MAG: hypothetical protein A2923_00330 [Candidatus Yanofskybacteria bacterium RIFCSPLOWO2_01_FULL_43_46]OGN29444.1 MAG: hypothetical protein A3I26_01510 [Candidatus Yanofskybacteria bacterium RIFCSPLOWO2_02_FULL_43_10]OGN33472.1 MAG: hypothetical protein A3G51_01760 